MRQIVSWFDNHQVLGSLIGGVAVIGGIRPASVFRMELRDPVLNRRIGHRYTIDVLPEVA